MVERISSSYFTTLFNKEMTMTIDQAKKNLEFANYLEFEVPDEQFNMGDWCETACCIAGHWYKKNRGKVPICPASIRVSIVSNSAKDGMGLSDEEHDELFLWNDVVWPSLGEIRKGEAAEKLREIVYRHYPDLQPGKGVVAGQNSTIDQTIQTVLT